MKRKIKWKNVIILLLFIIFYIGLTISIINIIKWFNDNKGTKEQINKISDTEIQEIKDNSNTEIIEQKEIDKSNPYWDYIKMNMIDVNFNDLKNINNDTKGWIKVNGTNINYPFVQTNDNNYYLTHTFDKTYNNAGWVFLDYRNSISELNQNTIIYAHGRLDTTMFGSLKNILNNNWSNNTDNYIVKTSTEYENTLWQVFSVYKIKTTSDYLKINFNSEIRYQEFLDMLINRSVFDFNTTINSSDKILTLSTCLNDNEKVVMHAKMIKKEKK